MSGPTRRRWLQVIAVGATGTCAGCTGAPAGTESDPGTESETTDDDESLTDWERSTDCEGEHDGMHDSVITVEGVRDSLDEEYAPIHFSDLTPGEKEILRTVTEEGGYGTCDASNSFTRFTDRVIDHRGRQEKEDVYLEREATYYQLYVEKLDQVYAH